MSRRKETDKAFSCFVVFMVPPTGQLKPEVQVQVIPDGSNVTVEQITPFCFPYHPKADVSLRRQEFVFTLTDADGTLQYGYCLQKEPATPASNAYCFCIVSLLNWFSFFQSVVAHTATLYPKDKELIPSFLDALLDYQYPDKWEAKGEPVRLHYSERVVSLHCPNQHILPPLSEEPNLRDTCLALSHSNLLVLVASILYERRIIITSSNLGLVTAVGHAVNRIVYPLAWQHIFIPIMPQQLLDYCSAPIPFIAGVHSSLIKAVEQMPLEEHVLIDVDANTIKSPFMDVDEVPQELLSPLKSAFKRSTTTRNDNTVLKACISMMLGIFGPYLEFFDHSSDGKFLFNTENFIQSKPRAWLPFMQAFVISQPWLQFIDQRQQELESRTFVEGIFEAHLDEYLEERRNTKDFKTKARKTFSKFKSTVVSKIRSEQDELLVPASGFVPNAAEQSSSMLRSSQAPATVRPARPRSEIVSIRDTALRRHKSASASDKPPQRSTKSMGVHGAAEARRLSRGAAALISSGPAQQRRHTSLTPRRMAPQPPPATAAATEGSADGGGTQPNAAAAAAAAALVVHDEETGDGPARASGTFRRRSSLNLSMSRPSSLRLSTSPPGQLGAEIVTKGRSKSISDMHRSNPFWAPGKVPAITAEGADEDMGRGPEQEPDSEGGFNPFGGGSQPTRLRDLKAGRGQRPQSSPEDPTQTIPLRPMVRPDVMPRSQSNPWEPFDFPQLDDPAAAAAASNPTAAAAVAPDIPIPARTSSISAHHRPRVA